MACPFITESVPVVSRSLTRQSGRERGELTSTQPLRQIHSKILLVILREWQIIHNVITPNRNHIDAQPLVLIVPNAEVVSPQLVPLQILEERVVFLCSNRPIVPPWPRLIVGGSGDWGPIECVLWTKRKPTVMFIWGVKPLMPVEGCSILPPRKFGSPPRG